MKITRKRYLEDMIEKKENELIGMQVEYEVAMRMSLGGTHVKQFEDIQMTIKNRMKATEELVKIYKDYLAKEE